MANNDSVAEFTGKLVSSLADGTFVRLVVSRPEKVLGRLVEIKGRPHLSLTYRHPTRDVTKNIPVTEAAKLAEGFRGAMLCTTQADYQLTGQRVITHKPTTTTPPLRAHDRQKLSLLDATADVWLRALDVTPKKRQQIDRYLEIFSHLTKEVAVKSVADMGCGKGYLTFGMWHLLRTRVIGVEQRPELVANANALARQIGAAGLEFMPGTIESVKLPAVDALIALHACDTATDDAIRRGIEMGAKLIVVAPCCHKEVRPQLGKPEPLGPVLEHGIMAERMAEWATDGLRALHLEAAGYRTKMIEFVSSEHTPKNLMIAGIRTGEPAGHEKMERFRAFFGIQHHALD